MVNNKKKRSKQKKAQRTAQAANNTNASSTRNSSRNNAHHAPSDTQHSSRNWSSLNLQDLIQGLPPEDMVRFNKLRQQKEQQQRNDGVIFTRKLKGASARLFAKGCESYLEHTMIRCFDTPADLPVWSGLSPQQRMKLMVELMVGLLCEDEPLENIQTEQHFVAYMTIWRLLRTVVEVEMDLEGETDDADVIEQLDAIRESCPSNEAKEGEISGKRTQEERDKFVRESAIQSKLASRYKKKMAKKFEKDIDDDNEEGKDNTIDDNKEDKDNDIVEKVASPAFPSSSWSLFDHRNDHLFREGPSPQDSRSHLRPNETENWPIYDAFKWRLLCDDAFQEDEDPAIYSSTPLKFLNFDWKHNDLYYLPSKWFDALKILLFYSDGFINNSRALEDMMSLHFGELDDATYADPKYHQRILDVTKTTKQWRTSFDDSHVDNTDFFKQQRCIYAVTATEFYKSEEDEKWFEAFCHACQEDNFSFKNVPGNYQKRLNAYRSLEDFDTPTTCYGHSKETFDPPITYYNSSIHDAGRLYEQCNESSCLKSARYEPKPDLFRCSGCKVVKYCSRECQKKDWPNHKKHCKALVSMAKEKRSV